MKTRFRRIVGSGLFTVFFLIPLVMLLEIPIALGGAALGAYLFFSAHLPKIPQLATYQPRTVSTFYADDGTVIGVFYKEKRYVVDIEQIPPHVVNAFLAAEDSRFYEHSGVDWIRIGGAALQNLKAGRIVQGGSTITMQVIRNFLLTRARQVSRKIKEMILATKIEKVWGKKKILHIYLNEIYLGAGCYGVEAAARGYFDKPVEHLTVGEAALITGLIASPDKYNPFKSMELARQRQMTVLGRMLRVGFINQEQYNQAAKAPIVLKKETVQPFDLVPDFAEAVRRYIVNKYGAEKLYHEGLKVFTTCKVDFQHQALEAMDKGLKEIKARQKHVAILRTVDVKRIPEILERRRAPTLVEGKIYQGVVVKVVPGKTQTDLHVAFTKKLKGLVRLEKGAAIAYKVGQVLALRFDKFVDDVAFFVPDNDPKLQGALVSIENRTGYVRALVGGATSEHFQFNRAVQGKRQPGSAFKPVIYSVALEKKSYSPATIIVDEPILVEMDNKEEEDWEPRNAGGEFLGPLSFRRALELSRNICTIKVLMDVQLDPVIEMAKKMGITSPLGRNLSLSLGTSELNLFELTAAYTVFPNSGVHVEPTLVKRIEDRFGNVLEDNTEVPVLEASEIPHPEPREEFKDLIHDEESDQPQNPDQGMVTPPVKQNAHSPENQGREAAAKPDALMGETNAENGTSRRVQSAMSPETAYIMTSLLQGGVRQGTGARLSQYMKRDDLAGKTGTTNNSEDTWFIGFNPDYTTGVWVGYDEKRPLGKQEAGGRAALPIWGYFMREILRNAPDREFPVPPDIVFEEMTTYAGSPKEGFLPRTVTEPVYAPFSGLTLIISPLDPPETLQQYPLTAPGMPYGQPSYGYGGGQQPLATYPGVSPNQPTYSVPLQPADGRYAPPPGQTTVPQAVPPGWNTAPGPPVRTPNAPVPREARPYPPQGQAPPGVQSQGVAPPRTPSPYWQQAPEQYRQ